MIITAIIINVAAIAISLPLAPVMAGYLGVSPEVILYAALTTAGMAFLLLVGAAPNPIVYNSRQFISGEFFRYGIPAGIPLMALVGLAVILVWPFLGMSILV
jgi:solute carrier family 13 (sodium-dependent dicarboxylate transporter), member 2/3/5